MMNATVRGRVWRTLGGCTVALTLTACSGESGPQALTLVAGGSGTGKNVAAGLEAGAMVDSRVGAWNVEYKIQGTFPDLPGAASAWRLRPLKASRALDVAAKIGDELGVSGSPEVISGDKSSYSIGTDSKDGSGMWVYVGERESSWSYYSGSGGAIAVGAPTCIKSEDGQERCVDPAPVQPPKNLPSTDQAIERVTSIITASGEPIGDFTLSATKDEWGTNVQAAMKIGGIDSSYSWWFTFGEDAAVISASGMVVSAERADEYPLVSPTKAVERLSTPWFGMPAVGFARDAVAVDSMAPEITGDSIPAPEPVVITITGVRQSLLSAYQADGEVVLLPAYVYSNADGDVGMVFAVEDKYITFEEPSTGGATGGGSSEEPAPIDPSGSSGSSGGSSGSGGVGGGSTSPSGSTGVDVPAQAIIPEEASKLVGLTEDEASKVAVSNGWSVRVAKRDGEAYMLTTDYQPDRVNLTIVKGVVTGVSVG